jgi:hypothetical protein
VSPKYKPTRYWIQRQDYPPSLNLLLCLVNACRYLGLPGPKPDSPKWARLARMSLEEQARALKVKLQPIGITGALDHCPSIIPIQGWSHRKIHVLVIGGDGGNLVLVNSRGYSFASRRSWEVCPQGSIRMVPKGSAWAVEPRNGL